MPTRVAVVGATGRLGSQIVGVINDSPDFELVASLSSRSDLAEMVGADIAVDATNPGSSPSVVEFGVRHNVKMLVGTSGWSRERIRPLESFVASTAGSCVYVVPNFSVGATLQLLASRLIAQHFESVEIIETHHIHKADSPSGTAIRTAEEIAKVRMEHGGVVAPHPNQAARGEQVEGIPVHSVRLEGVLAEQSVVFGGGGETLTLTHHTHSRDAYQHGIERALAFVRENTGLFVGLEHALRDVL